MKQWIGSASSVEEAVTEGTKSLGLSRDQVDVEVLEEQSSNLFSMIGYRRVRVKVSERPEGAPPRRPQRPEGRRDERGRPPQQQQPHGRPQGGRDDFRRRDEGRRDGGTRRDVSRRDDARTDNARSDTPRSDNTRKDDTQQDNRSWRGRDDRYDYGPSEPRRDDRGGTGQRDGNQGGRRDERGPSQNRAPNDRRPGGGFQGGRGQEQGRRPVSNDHRNDDRRRDQNRLPRERPEGGPAPERVPQNRPPLPERPLRADLPQNLEGHLTMWKQWLGWDDLEWTLETPEGDSVAVTLKTSRKEQLFGSGGEALEAFEHLFNTVVSRAIKERPRALFQLEGFSDPKKQRVVDEANHAAAEVKRSGGVFRLDPMGSTERRLVHQTLANDPDVETYSEGEGPWRKVVVRPKKKA